MRWFLPRPRLSFKEKAMLSGFLSPNGRKVAEEILEGDSLIIERLCNIIGDLQAQKPQ